MDVHAATWYFATTGDLEEEGVTDDLEGVTGDLG